MTSRLLPCTGTNGEKLVSMVAQSYYYATSQVGLNQGLAQTNTQLTIQAWLNKILPQAIYSLQACTAIPLHIPSPSV